ncbi:MAG: DMT family transporter [Oligoflexia bacterium]|nr:DMT family transporter [Oligoflexia bacterium]MBF0365419.1 DMT family transporter [Oligoflexia bacterium]
MTPTPTPAQEQKIIAYAKRGLLYGALSGAFWGLDGVLLGIAMTMLPFTSPELAIYVAPLVGACLHDGLAALWLSLLNLSTGRGREIFRSLMTKPGLIVCFAALLGGPLAMSGYLLGIQFAGTAYTLSITAIYPALGTIFAMIFLKERVSLRAWIGIITCIIGSFVVGYTPPEGGVSPHFYMGILFALIPTIGWSLEGVISTYVMDLLDPSIAINIRQATSFVVYLLAVMPLIGGLIVFKSALLATSGAVILLTALVGSISYLFWYKAMNMTGVARAMCLNITYALWGIVFGYFLTDLKLTPTLIIGAIIITIGALLVVANPKELLNLRKV